MDVKNLIIYSMVLITKVEATYDLFTYKLTPPWKSSITTRVYDIPDPKDTTAMARYVVHNSDWASISYISHAKETKGLPLLSKLSVSDGPESNGTGTPYFYVSQLQAAINDLIDHDSNCSLLLTLAQGPLCKQKNWDPEDPRCAEIILVGTFQKVSNSSSEYKFAKDAIFSRHPSLIDLPENHHFFFAKLNIKRIIVQDTFGGPSVVPVEDYFSYDGEGQGFIRSSADIIKNNIVILYSLGGIFLLLS